MTGRLASTVFATCLGLIVVMVPACSRPEPPCTGSETGANPVDPPLLAFLSRARSAHHIADVSEESDAAAAIRALVSVVDGPVPVRDGSPPAEAREVMADTQARIAELESRLLRFDSATRRIDLALQWVPEVSYFRGHLFETRGIVEQRQAQDHEKSGRAAEAAAANGRALAAFESAMQIQAEVIRQTPTEPTMMPIAGSAGKGNGATSGTPR